MSHSSSEDYANLVEELGEVQNLSAAIARRTNSRDISRIFSQVCNIIWRHCKDSVASLRQAASRCYDFLSGYDPDQLAQGDSAMTADIQTVYQRVAALSNASASQ